MLQRTYALLYLIITIESNESFNNLYCYIKNIVSGTISINFLICIVIDQIHRTVVVWYCETSLLRLNKNKFNLITAAIIDIVTALILFKNVPNKTKHVMDQDLFNISVN